MYSTVSTSEIMKLRSLQLMGQVVKLSQRRDSVVEYSVNSMITLDRMEDLEMEDTLSMLLYEFLSRLSYEYRMLYGTASNSMLSDETDVDKIAAELHYIAPLFKGVG
jgi:hypothetical protein